MLQTFIVFSFSASKSIALIFYFFLTAAILCFFFLYFKTTTIDQHCMSSKMALTFVSSHCMLMICLWQETTQVLWKSLSKKWWRLLRWQISVWWLSFLEWKLCKIKMKFLSVRRNMPRRFQRSLNLKNAKKWALLWTKRKSSVKKMKHIRLIWHISEV